MGSNKLRLTQFMDGQADHIPSPPRLSIKRAPVTQTFSYMLDNSSKEIPEYSGKEWFQTRVDNTCNQQNLIRKLNQL